MKRVLLWVLIAMMLPAPDGTGPWLSGMAQADDGDDDGGDDGDDDSGGSSSGARGDRGGGDAAAPRRLAPRRPAAPARGAGNSPVTASAPAPDFAPDEVVALGLGPGDLAVLLALGYRLIEQRSLSALDGVSSVRLGLPPGRSLEIARAELRRIAPTAAADFNHFYRTDQAPPEAAPAAVAPSCTDGPACDQRNQVGWPLPAGAARTACAPGGTIGMIDTGVNPDHAALAGRVELVRLDQGSLAASDLLHGTAVAALLVGAPDSRTPGLLPQAQLVAVDVFHKVGADQRSSAFALIAGLDLLALRGIRVINLSLSGPPNAVLERMVTSLSRQGVLLVAAAGNGGAQAGLAWPAAYPEVIGVTAVDRRGNIYRRAQQGPHVELAAPGVQVWTAASVAGGRPRNGTSFAAPFVSATAQLLMAQGLDAAAARAALGREAVDLGPEGPDTVFGLGLLHAARLCRAAQL